MRTLQPCNRVWVAVLSMHVCHVAWPTQSTDLCQLAKDVRAILGKFDDFRRD